MSNLAKYVFPTVIDEAIIYPDSDGKPMSDNTKQYQYIILLQVNLDTMFAANPDIFVAADLLWYPVQGRPSIRAAPDTMVIFGRPKGHRGSYKQWEEAGIAPQIAFEILSPGNTWREMNEKRLFYERYGVQEYYEYDPDEGRLQIWLREDDLLRPVAFVGAWRSPLLDITMRVEADGELSVYFPDGRKFLPPVELQTELWRVEAEAARERARAEQEHLRAEQERKRAEQVEQDNARLIAKLRELGIDPTTL
ncbi:MAG: Uma2 family endonuclease [Blastocatellia bacterium]|nr:Uma2 family endonuclease [Blastocatellia bacterium]